MKKFCDLCCCCSCFGLFSKKKTPWNRHHSTGAGKGYENNSSGRLIDRISINASFGKGLEITNYPHLVLDFASKEVAGNFFAEYQRGFEENANERDGFIFRDEARVTIVLPKLGIEVMKKGDLRIRQSIDGEEVDLLLEEKIIRGDKGSKTVITNTISPDKRIEHLLYALHVGLEAINDNSKTIELLQKEFFSKDRTSVPTGYSLTPSFSEGVKIV